MVLAVFLRPHRASIDVHIRINLNRRDLQTGRFQQQTSRGGCKILYQPLAKESSKLKRTDDTLPDTTHDTSRHENILHIYR